MSDPDATEVQTQVPPPKPKRMMAGIALALSTAAFVSLWLGACTPGAVLAVAAAIAGAFALATSKLSDPDATDPVRIIPPPRPPAAATVTRKSDPDPTDPSRLIPPPRPIMPPPPIQIALGVAFDVSAAIVVALGDCRAATPLAGLAVVAGLVAVVQLSRGGKRKP
jgi:hypothetical protein